MRKNGTGRRIIPKPTSSCTSLEQTSCTSNLAKYRRKRVKCKRYRNRYIDDQPSHVWQLASFFNSSPRFMRCGFCNASQLANAQLASWSKFSLPLTSLSRSIYRCRYRRHPHPQTRDPHIQFGCRYNPKNVYFHRRQVDILPYRRLLWFLGSFNQTSITPGGIKRNMPSYHVNTLFLYYSDCYSACNRPNRIMLIFRL